MFHEIAPHSYHVEYQNKKPSDNDLIIIIENNQILVNLESPTILPTYAMTKTANLDSYTYLFAVNNTNFFLSNQVVTINNDFTYASIGIFRGIANKIMAFAGPTAFSLAMWYQNNKYCKKCGASLILKHDERALVCSKCHNIEFPIISPAILVGVFDGNRLLLTKYANRDYKNHALIAGFTEIGETLEATVKREVYEEVGLHVKNICYYKSQPWPFSNSMLFGFFAELEGSNSVKLDNNELSEAAWFDQKDIPEAESLYSLTWEMIDYFKKFGPLKQNS